jgi:hypothetical protein
MSAPRAEPRQSFTHRLVETPGDEDQERDNEQGDLDTGSDGYTDGEIELVFDADSDGCNVLGGVSDNRQEAFREV